MRLTGLRCLLSALGYEVLADIALTVLVEFEGESSLRFCAFNGGADCLVDLGSKQDCFVYYITLLRVSCH